MRPKGLIHYIYIERERERERESGKGAERERGREGESSGPDGWFRKIGIFLDELRSKLLKNDPAVSHTRSSIGTTASPLVLLHSKMQTSRFQSREVCSTLIVNLSSQQMLPRGGRLRCTVKRILNGIAFIHIRQVTVFSVDAFNTLNISTVKTRPIEIDKYIMLK